jgi:hypothetical protein
VSVGALLALKFLREGGVGPFSYFQWPLPSAGEPGAWVAAEPGDRGIYACDAEHLVYWLAPELWIIELDGEVEVEGTKLVAPRGRLIRRVEAWTREKLAAFGQECALRTRDRAAAAIRGLGEGDLADRLAACTDAASISELAAAASRGAARPLGREIVLSLGYAADALTFAPIDPSASLLVAAHVGLTQESYVEERAWQSRRLAADLDLFELVREPRPGN